MLFAMGTKTLMTVEQFAALPDDDLKHELDEGELITMSLPKSSHTKVACRTYDAMKLSLLGQTGNVYFEAGCRIAPDTLRGPDVAFFRADHLDESGYFIGAPDIAVDVISPSDTVQKLNRKVRQYLENGSEEVWVIDPEDREVHVHRKSGTTVVRDTPTTPLLPGLHLSLADLFSGV